MSLPDEQTFESIVGQLGDVDYPTPVIALVGDVARLRHQTAPTVQRTLYTGLVSPNPDYIHTPLIEIEPVSFVEPSIEDYDYLLFTSRYAVKAVGHSSKATGRRDCGNLFTDRVSAFCCLSPRRGCRPHERHKQGLHPCL